MKLAQLLPALATATVMASSPPAQDQHFFLASAAQSMVFAKRATASHIAPDLVLRLVYVMRVTLVSTYP
ncbi:unnamed protein product [Protopolystoma xenopodis]|uniref:Uncharacterized protein n=1 Tax=Protopolystoma xenopodis TaxID=117903 RepID=A0A448X1P5_9PLAT|nr:unnamed protein product [Protopolystoma xenopodis]